MKTIAFLLLICSLNCEVHARAMGQVGDGDEECEHCGNRLDSNVEVPLAGDTPPHLQCDPTKYPIPNPNRYFINEVSYDSRCPDGMVFIEDDDGNYCIDKFEGSLLHQAPGLPKGTWSPFHKPHDDGEYFAISVAGSVPQTMISGTMATKACANSNKRMCSDREWLRACRGPDNRNFPFTPDTYTVKQCKDAGKTITWRGAGQGDNRPARCDLKCNDTRPFDKDFEQARRTAPGIQNPCLNQWPDTIARAGANAGCQTPEGVFDLMGNAHEWTDNPKGSFRGGWYMDTFIEGQGCHYNVTDSSLHPGRGQWDMSTGFRCCADPN